MLLDRRLRQLEQRVSPCVNAVPAIAVVDDGGQVVDDGSIGITPWIGRTPTSLPTGTQIIRGIDFRRVLGVA
ncbi:MAG: hypothetical protein K2X38_03225 [Gemmataceae bacterium]|nr:hypothetical protein [Gemmataceae bacterium]